MKNYEEDAKHGTKLSNATFSKNRSYIDQHIMPYFGAKNIAHVTPKNILKWQDWMQARIAPQTANAVLGVLNRAMSHFVLEEYIPFNPCSEIKNLPIADVEHGYTPTYDEIYRLLDEAHHRNFVDDVVHQASVGDERDLKTWMWHHHALARKGDKSRLKRGVYLKANGMHPQKISHILGINSRQLKRAQDEAALDIVYEIEKITKYS